MRGLRTRIELDINNNIELVSLDILQKMESLISALFSNHPVAYYGTRNAVGIGPSAPSLFLLGITNNHVFGEVYWVIRDFSNCKTKTYPKTKIGKFSYVPQSILARRKREGAEGPIPTALRVP